VLRGPHVAVQPGAGLGRNASRATGNQEQQQACSTHAQWIACQHRVLQRCERAGGGAGQAADSDGLQEADVELDLKACVERTSAGRAAHPLWPAVLSLLSSVGCCGFGVGSSVDVLVLCVRLGSLAAVMLDARASQGRACQQPWLPLPTCSSARLVHDGTGMFGTCGTGRHVRV